jgi:DNA-binding MarR family transcriptional regulator
VEEPGFPGHIPLVIQMVMLGHRLGHRLERRLAGFGYNRTQAAIINILLRHPGLSPQHFVFQVAVEAPSITRGFQALERLGLVERRPHPKDGRASRFFLTPAGETEAQRIASLMQEISAEIEDGMSAEQRHFFREGLTIALAHVEQTRGTRV